MSSCPDLDGWRERAIRAEKEAERLREDIRFLLQLVPAWADELPVPKGLDPTFYGTLTAEGDEKVALRLREIRQALSPDTCQQQKPPEPCKTCGGSGKAQGTWVCKNNTGSSGTVEIDCPNGCKPSWWLEDEEEVLLAEVGTYDLRVCLTIETDPRTGKPWRSMKAARDWYDEVTGPGKYKEPYDAGEQLCQNPFYFGKD